MRDDITLGQLRTFVCAARLESFIKAADQLGISQPAVSDQIARLEERLKQPLFQRRRGTTPTLTPFGQTVLEEVETILASSQKIVSSGNSETPRERVKISIGSYLRDAYLNPLISKIWRKYPTTDIDLRPIISSDKALNQLHQNQSDIVVCTSSSAELPGLKTVKVCDVPVAFVVAPSVRAALTAGEISFGELDFLIPTPRNARTIRMANRLIREAKLGPVRPPRFLDSAEMVCRMAKEGLGAAYLMPETILPELKSGELEILDLEVPANSRIIAVCANPSPAVRYIESELRKSFLRDSHKLDGYIRRFRKVGVPLRI